MIPLTLPEVMQAGSRIWYVLLFVFTFLRNQAQPYPEVQFAFAGTADLASGKTDDGAGFRQEALSRSARARARINLFVFSREKKVTAATVCFRFNATVQSIFHRNIRFMRVSSLDELTSRLDRYMADHPDVMLGHLWLDSHGRYRKGHALFSVGRDTVWAENIFTDSIYGRLQRITAYCDADSKVSLGACYSGADYTRPGNESLRESPMRGDSLLQSMASIFSLSPVYACKSWIMVKPFMFGRRWGLAGFPRRSRFLDEIYRPAWERTGQWSMVPSGSREVVSIGTPYLSAGGNLVSQEQTYQSVPKHRTSAEKHIKRLRAGMYDVDRK